MDSLNNMPFLYPAYYAENKAFDQNFQNPVAKEVIPRIVALVAPILFAYQTALYFVVGVANLALCLCQITPGIVCQGALLHLQHSIKGLASSFCEIPEKLAFGANRQINYFGDDQRYSRKDLSEHYELI